VTFRDPRHTIAVCIPARNEAETITPVVCCAAALRDQGVVDEVVVVDDGSTDDTAVRASAAGAHVIVHPSGRGKGDALATAVAATDSDLLVFLDADVTNIGAHFVTELVQPLLHDRGIQLVKPTYRRAMRGQADEGGRVTELLARPLLRRFFPEVADLVRQPLAGETATRRTAIEAVGLAGGYSIEMALLLDVYLRHGSKAIAQVDLGERAHRNRPLQSLAGCADDVLAAVMDRVDPFCAEDFDAA